MSDCEEKCCGDGHAAQNGTDSGGRGGCVRGGGCGVRGCMCRGVCGRLCCGGYGSGVCRNRIGDGNGLHNAMIVLDAMRGVYCIKVIEHQDGGDNQDKFDDAQRDDGGTRRAFDFE